MFRPKYRKEELMLQGDKGFVEIQKTEEHLIFIIWYRFLYSIMFPPMCYPNIIVDIVENQIVFLPSGSKSRFEDG